MEPVLHARMPLKKKGLLLWSRITVEEVVAALLAEVEGAPLEPLATSHKLSQPDSFAVTLHPAGGFVGFRVMEDHVEVLAMTGDLGPGYHAFMVSILESAANKLGVAWEWDDKTGYVQDRDFAKLQSRMAEYLKELAGASEEGGGSAAELAGRSIRVDVEVETDEDEVLTPLGPKSVDEVQRWRKLEGVELNRAAADFFPWWGQGFDGSFYRGLALYSLWNDIRWAYPIDPKEVELAKRTLRWCKEAVNRDVIDAAFLPSVLNEVSAVILAKENPVHFPDRQGVGYRRRMMRKRLGHGWALTIPASLGDRVDAKDSTTSVLVNHVLDIRISHGITPSRRPLQPGEIDRRDMQVEFRDDTIIFNLAARALRTADTDAICRMTVTLQDEQYKDLIAQIVESLEYDADDAD